MTAEPCTPLDSDLWGDASPSVHKPGGPIPAQRTGSTTTGTSTPGASSSGDAGPALDAHAAAEAVKASIAAGQKPSAQDVQILSLTVGPDRTDRMIRALKDGRDVPLPPRQAPTSAPSSKTVGGGGWRGRGGVTTGGPTGGGGTGGAGTRRGRFAYWARWEPINRQDHPFGWLFRPFRRAS